jgi:hypothetical protein
MSRSPYGRSDYRGRDPERDRYDREPRSREAATGGRWGRDDDPYDNPANGRRGGRNRSGGGGGPGGGPGSPQGGGPGGMGSFQFNVATVAVLAGVLIVGIGIGTGLSSTTQGDQGNIASSQQLDMAVPDPEFCRQWGASAFVMDIELYTTMNPSSSFVTQPALKPGCVIRRENWSVLQKEGAVTAEQMRQCKQRMNTFAYIGSVKDKPIVRCVYQTDITDNKFLTKGVADDTVGVTPEADQF